MAVMGKGFRPPNYLYPQMGLVGGIRTHPHSQLPDFNLQINFLNFSKLSLIFLTK